jgi:hypothetical protein
MKTTDKFSFLLLCLAIVAVGCDENKSPATSSSGTAYQQTQPSSDAAAAQTRPLTAEESAEVKSQGLNPEGMVVQTQPQQPQEPMALVYLDQFMGSANTSIPVKIADLISIKTDQLKFRFGGQSYDYSGHYAILFPQARKHSGSILGFGGPTKAKYVFIHSSGLDMPMQDATVWESKGGFIDVEAMGHEFICSGSFEMQN